MINKRVVVLSNASQYTAFIREGYKAKDFIIFCDNQRFAPILKNQGIQYQLLEEPLIQKEWPAINAWGSECASQWIKRSNEKKLFLTYDFPSILFFITSKNI